MVSVHTIKAYSGNGGTAIFNLGTGWRWGVNLTDLPP